MRTQPPKSKYGSYTKQKYEIQKIISKQTTKIKISLLKKLWYIYPIKKQKTINIIQKEKLRIILIEKIKKWHQKNLRY